MKLAALLIFAIAVFSIKTINGFDYKYPQQQQTCACPICTCPPPQIVEKKVYVNSCPNNNVGGGVGGGVAGQGPDKQKTCYYNGCDSVYPVCGVYNGKCKLYKCLNNLYNDDCEYGGVQNVNLKYCQGMSEGGSFATCKNM